MTLVLHAPTSPVNPAIPVNTLSEFLRSRMIEECKSTVIRVAEEAMREITEALSAFGVPAQVAPVVATEPVVPAEPAPAVPEVSKSETIQSEESTGVRGGRNLNNRVAQHRRTLEYVVPIMVKHDKDFGGTLYADEVCARFQISSKVYNRYKEKALILRRCYKGFGGEMNEKQTRAAACMYDWKAFNAYIKLIKEGLDDKK